MAADLAGVSVAAAGLVGPSESSGWRPTEADSIAAVVGLSAAVGTFLAWLVVSDSD